MVSPNISQGVVPGVSQNDSGAAHPAQLASALAEDESQAPSLPKTGHGTQPGLIMLDELRAIQNTLRRSPLPDDVSLAAWIQNNYLQQGAMPLDTTGEVQSSSAFETLLDAYFRAKAMTNDKVPEKWPFFKADGRVMSLDEVKRNAMSPAKQKGKLDATAQQGIVPSKEAAQAQESAQEVKSPLEKEPGAVAPVDAPSARNETSSGWDRLRGTPAGDGNDDDVNSTLSIMDILSTPVSSHLDRLPPARTATKRKSPAGGRTPADGPLQKRPTPNSRGRGRGRPRGSRGRGILRPETSRNSTVHEAKQEEASITRPMQDVQIVQEPKEPAAQSPSDSSPSSRVTRSQTRGSATRTIPASSEGRKISHGPVEYYSASQGNVTPSNLVVEKSARTTTILDSFAAELERVPKQGKSEKRKPTNLTDIVPSQLLQPKLTVVKNYSRGPRAKSNMLLQGGKGRDEPRSENDWEPLDTQDTGPPAPRTGRSTRAQLSLNSSKDEVNKEIEKRKTESGFEPSNNRGNKGPRVGNNNDEKATSVKHALSSTRSSSLPKGRRGLKFNHWNPYEKPSAALESDLAPRTDAAPDQNTSANKSRATKTTEPLPGPSSNESGGKSRTASAAPETNTGHGAATTPAFDNPPEKPRSKQTPTATPLVNAKDTAQDENSGAFQRIRALVGGREKVLESVNDFEEYVQAMDEEDLDVAFGTYMKLKSRYRKK